MKEWQSQAHVKWECEDHVVIVPKYRKKAIYGKLRQQIGEMFRPLCRQKEIELLEGHARADHVHMLLRVPPRDSIAMTVGYLKGQSAIRIHREYGTGRGALLGRSFWSRGYCVSTVGFNEQAVRQYIQEQQDREKREEQGSLMFD